MFLTVRSQGIIHLKFTFFLANELPDRQPRERLRERRPLSTFFVSLFRCINFHWKNVTMQCLVIKINQVVARLTAEIVDAVQICNTFFSEKRLVGLSELLGSGS